MAAPLIRPALEIDGKFFRRNGRRLWLKTVTYGPFPPEKEPLAAVELARIRDAGFDSIRLFSLPDRQLLEAAERCGVIVFAGLDWNHHEDFLSQPGILSAARIRLAGWLETHANHPALAGIYVGNEIPCDLVRWMGPAPVREAIEGLIELGKRTAPHLLFAYANYPSTEYLEPGTADFSAFNIYLEEKEPFAAYLRRLQNIAGDRPLLVSEFGMDTHRNSPGAQAHSLGWALEIAHREETAGFTAYAWSDLWMNAGREILDWSFGITDRMGNPKPALQVCRDFSPAPPATGLRFSVIVCTRNGGERIENCLRAIAAMDGGPYETLVIDDGSDDGTAKIVSRNFPNVRLLSIPPSGLSAARNIGADAASGDILAFTDDDCEPDREWLVRLGKAFLDPGISAAGGPNLPPLARTPIEAVIRSAPGAPSHVLLDDTRAEHLPGCNIAVRKEVFAAVGGFDPIFRTAGDDVDFCWRLSDSGHRLGFVPGAFVWHWRRPSIRAFLRQQMGYGKAEKLLLAKHPVRFGKNGDARWTGFVYGGGAVGVGETSIIYHGAMGQAGYQSIVNRMLPLRPIDPTFRDCRTEFLLSFLNLLQPMARRWARNRRFKLPSSKALPPHPEPTLEFGIPGDDTTCRDHHLRALLEKGWQATGDTDPWDLEKGGTRILIATARPGPNMTNNLFRVWGSPEAALALRREISA
ncbi:glycosyltransferase [Akkermansiaceae bacterium]|nr:glycosyltransferase [Akkermansiaceae bacterium]